MADKENMIERKIDTLVFDFDGTIADTNKLIVDSWQAVYRAYTGEDGDEEYIISTFGEPLYDSMRKSFPDHDVEETVAIYRNYQKEIFRDEIKAFPGMVELIKGLKASGYKIGIATARLRFSTLEGLDVMGIKEAVDALVTVEDTDKHKPHPEPALMCLEKLGSVPERSIFVGDSAFDMGCGKNAGMSTVMVGWSQAAASSRESVAMSGEHYTGDQLAFVPDHIIEKAEDLWRILDA